MEESLTITTSLAQDFLSYIDRSDTTTRAYMKNLRQFMEYTQELGITQPTRQDIILYRQSLIDRGLKPNTIAAYLQSVRQFFGWTAAAGIYPNVADNIHPPKIDRSSHRKDALQAQEVQEIETSIKSRAAGAVQAARVSGKDRAGRIQRATEGGLRLTAMYLLAVNAGLRTIEIARANIEDLETRGGQTWLFVWGKGHTEPDTRKALAPEVAQAIRDYLGARRDKPGAAGPLFVATGNRSGGQRLAATTISTMLKRAMQAAGYDSPRLTAHSLRHTTGTAVQELTGDLFATQKYMRHKDSRTTQIYLHNDTERQEAQTAARLYAYYHGEGGPG